jgi:TonB family protein
MEDVVRLSLYQACGGDRELRCQQFGPLILRGIPPTIPLRALRCRETGSYPRRARDCSFTAGDEKDRATICRVTLRERSGIYWSDELPPPEPPKASGTTASIPMVPIGRSSLACAGPLLALTREPEKIDPAPATPPRGVRELASLITEDDYPIPAVSKGREGTTTMRLRVGSHGRIDRCTVTLSSGSEGLDERACQLLRARAFFLPARNAEGHPVAAEISYSHHWKAPR